MPFVALLVARGWTERAAQAASVAIMFAGIVMVAVAATFAMSWAIDRHDRKVVDQYENKVSLDSVTRQASAEREANTNYTAAKVEQAREEAELRHEASKGDGSSVGPGVDAVLERLRRESGRPAADPARR